MFDSSIGSSGERIEIGASAWFAGFHVTADIGSASLDGVVYTLITSDEEDLVGDGLVMHL